MSVRQVCRDDVQQQEEDVFIDIEGTGKLDVPVLSFTICDLQKCAARVKEQFAIPYRVGGNRKRQIYRRK